MIEMPIVDRDKCDGCGLCITVCHCKALVLADGRITVLETAECDWCTQCEGACPLGAIRCAFEIVIEERRTTIS